ncbi:hypothetical protein Hanom_Chr15g01343841 [Helianthus anomalus]
MFFLRCKLIVQVDNHLNDTLFLGFFESNDLDDKLTYGNHPSFRLNNNLSGYGDLFFKDD